MSASVRTESFHKPSFRMFSSSFSPPFFLQFETDRKRALSMYARVDFEKSLKKNRVERRY